MALGGHWLHVPVIGNLALRLGGSVSKLGHQLAVDIGSRGVLANFQ
jgi:hypothetical protein